MVKYEKMKVVEEDAVVGKKCRQHKTSHLNFENKFKFPFTVSFTDEGEYRVVIIGTKAEVLMIEDNDAVLNEKYNSYECPCCGHLVIRGCGHRYCPMCGFKLGEKDISMMAV